LNLRPAEREREREGGGREGRERQRGREGDEERVVEVMEKCRIN
jgi:hypothetical protein